MYVFSLNMATLQIIDSCINEFIFMWTTSAKHTYNLCLINLLFLCLITDYPVQDFFGSNMISNMFVTSSRTHLKVSKKLSDTLYEVYLLRKKEEFYMGNYRASTIPYPIETGNQ